MTWEEYKIEALKTWNGNKFTEEQAFEYIIMKLIEEFGELMGSLAKEKYHGKPNNNLEELGDIYWYLAVWESMLSTLPKIDFTEHTSDTINTICDCLLNLININRNSMNSNDKYFSRIKSKVHGIAYELKLKEYKVWQANIAKLRARHGESYNAKHYTGESND